MEFGIEKCTMLVMKSGKRHITERIELLNQVVIRALGKQETYKYLRILESDIIKHVEMKEKKILKSISEETEKYLRLLEPCQRNKCMGCSPCKILETILGVDQRRT